MMKPTIHSNGTGRESLLNQVLEVGHKVQDALTALSEAAPNGRDYYTQGPDAYKQARLEHEERRTKLNEVYNDMQMLALYICDAL